MENFSQFFDAEPDAKRSVWVVDRCTGPKHTLNTIVPSGFKSYLRICHPGWLTEALNPDDEEAWSALRAGRIDTNKMTPVRWRDVATANNHACHRLMQWYQICPYHARNPGPGGIDPPLDGMLTKEIVERLFELFTDYGRTDQEVLCGFWEGYNRPDLYQSKAKFESFYGQQNYLLFHTTLSKARSGWLAAYDHASNYLGFGADGLTPNAIWPSSCDWYLAVPYFQQSSYIGGPAELIQSISDSTTLETYEAFPGDDIWNNA